ncbi:MAG: hypothetical protein DWQ02_04730 [Bacteroidetes bacterium]|nr:MAG: hypothetical protein DWQ02_04730 [Bacteroidota bacterium]
MNNAKFFCIVVFFLLKGTTLTGQEVITLEPVFSEYQIILLDEITGSWEIDLFGMDTLTFKKSGDNFYQLIISSASTSPIFEAVITQIGEHLILDLCPLGYEEKINDFRLDYLAKNHAVFKIDLAEDSLHLGALNYRWFYKNVIQKDEKITGYSWSASSLLLTAPTDSVRNLIETYGNERDFFVEDLHLRRLNNPKTLPQFRINDFSKPETPIQPCQPVFPLKDGWLGGDGDVCVPFGPNKTLWLFSDSFVGERDQITRQGANMVANTIGIMECGKNGEVDVQYYWGNMYKELPQPFFQTFTDRYRYWIADAFWVGKDLYVVLPKIGPKFDAHPDEIFNFSFLGFSLARIENPVDISPDQWNIEFFSWPVLPVGEEWHWSVTDEGFLYFPLENESGQIYLGRLPLKHLLCPKGNVEQLNDRILFTGDPGNSIHHYPDLQKWVIVSGPGFLSNKIKLRTAPNLNGPWSEEILVYETPEQTPGSAIFDRDNLCYLGRDHPSYFYAEKNELLITYDWNVTKFHKLLSSLEIYVPRMIRVKIPQ